MWRREYNKERIYYFDSCMRAKRFFVVLAIGLFLLGLVAVRQRREMSVTPVGVTPVETPVRGEITATPVTTEFAFGPGDYEYTVLLGSVERRYLIHVPPSYDKVQALPLVLFFHGGGGNMNHSSRAYGLKEKANKEGFIIAFTNGDSRLPNDKFATWNAGSCCGYARDSKIDDVGYTRAVLEDIESKFAIDTKRVFATGMSNGGMMAHRLACEMADTFRAVASVTGTDGTLTCTPARPISVLHIHAKNDDHVLFDGGAGENAFRDLDTVTDFVSVPETIARWVKRDQLNTTPKRVLEVPGAYCDLYTGTANTTQVKLCVTESGAHSWPGSRQAILREKEAPSKAIIANDVIWDFFRTQP